MPEHHRVFRDGKVEIYLRHSANMDELKNWGVCRWCGRMVGGIFDGQLWEDVRPAIEAELGRPVQEMDTPLRPGGRQPVEPMLPQEGDPPDTNYNFDISGSGPCPSCEEIAYGAWARRKRVIRAKYLDNLPPEPAEDGDSGEGAAS